MWAVLFLYEIVVRSDLHDTHHIGSGGFSLFHFSGKNTGGDDAKVIFFHIARLFDFFDGFFKYFIR